MTTVNTNLQINTDYTSQNAAGSTVKDDEKVSVFINDGERCTDGVNDGNLGARVAAKNFVKGAVSSSIGLLKGMFTDDNGDFSLGKTALTVGVGAACIAFPPLGYGLCALGALNGGYHVVKGVGKALMTNDDAQAKLAWQEAGGGTATGLLSRVGMKASRSAMKSSAAPKGTPVNSTPNVSQPTNAPQLPAPKGTNASAPAANSPSHASSTAKDSAKSLVGDIIDSTANSVSNIAKDSSKLFGALKTGAKSLKSKMPSSGNIKSSVQNTKNNISKDNVKNYINDKIDNISVSNAKQLGSDAYNSIVNALANGKQVPELISKYGYENVSQVVKMLVGEEAASEVLLG